MTPAPQHVDPELWNILTMELKRLHRVQQSFQVINVGDVKIGAHWQDTPLKLYEHYWQIKLGNVPPSFTNGKPTPHNKDTPYW